VGWAIGRGESYANPDTQDDIESRALYELLEQQIVPTFYDRDANGIPRKWVERVKRCIAELAPVYNTNRMVRDYAEQYYLPSLRRSRFLGANNLEKSITLAHQKERLRANWGKLRIEEVTAQSNRTLSVREQLPISVVAFLDSLAPHELRLQAFSGHLNNDNQITGGSVVDLVHQEDLGGGRHRFGGFLSTQSSGRYGFAIRIVPGGETFTGITEPGLVLWERSAPTPAPAHDKVAT
jgi:starch phosphorylase